MKAEANPEGQAKPPKRKEQSPRLKPPKVPCELNEHNWLPFATPGYAVVNGSAGDSGEIYVVCNRCWRKAWVEIEKLR